MRKWFEMGLDQWEALVFSHFTVYFNISAHYFILKVKKLRHQETISTTTGREGRDKFHVWSECDFISPQPPQLYDYLVANSFLSKGP